MNNDLANFYIEFTTKGLTELKDGMKDLDNKLNSLNDKFTSGASKGDTFFDKFTSWGLKLSALIAGFAGLGSVIANAFNVSDRIVELNRVADVAGTTAEKVEAMSLALQASGMKGNTVQAAGDLYKNILNLKGNLLNFNQPAALTEIQKRANFYLDPHQSVDDMILQIADELAKTVGRNDEYSLWLRNKLKEGTGISDDQMLLLEQGRAGVQTLLEYGRKNSYLSGEENLQMALENKKAREELKRAWDKVSIELIPLLTEIIQLLIPIVDALKPIAKWAVQQIGGLIETAEDVYDLLAGEKNMDEFTQAMTEKNNIFGDAARWGVGAASYLANAWHLQDIRAASERFKEGTASLQDITALIGYSQDQGWYHGEVKTNLDTAFKHLMLTNNALNSKNTGSIRDVSVENTINITGQDREAGRRAGQAIADTINPASLATLYK